jgi:hypothetical protein
MITTTVEPPAVEAVRDAGFEPYIPASTALRELTVPPLVVGTVLGMISARLRSIQVGSPYFSLNRRVKPHLGMNST